MQCLWVRRCVFGGVIAADTAVLLALTSSCSEWECCEKHKIGPTADRADYLPSQAGLLTQGVRGSHRTPWHPVEDPLGAIHIGKVP